MARAGGLLLAVPELYLALLDAAMESHEGVLGPSQEFISDFCEEDDELNVVPLGRACSVMVVDVSDVIPLHNLPNMIQLHMISMHASLLTRTGLLHCLS